MQGYTYQKGITPEEEAEKAYWERNMLAFKYAKRVNCYEAFLHSLLGKDEKDFEPICGWYYDENHEMDGWSRIVALDSGTICFHIPDNFDVGDLPEIKPTWDGYTTKEEWDLVAFDCGMDMLTWKD